MEESILSENSINSIKAKLEEAIDNGANKRCLAVFNLQCLINCKLEFVYINQLRSAAGTI